MASAKERLRDLVERLTEAQAEQLLEWVDEEILDVDVEAHLKWLETGAGDPWPGAA